MRPEESSNGEHLGSDQFAGQRVLRVLLVDDSVVSRRLVAKMLEHLGCTVTTAKDGLAATETASENEFDIMLMDCHMPVMDGYEAAAVIRRSNGKVPILALTADELERDRPRCSDAGMNEVLRKPITLSALEASLRRWTNGGSREPSGPNRVV